MAELQPVPAYSLSTWTRELSAGLAALCRIGRETAKTEQGEALPHLSQHDTGLDPSSDNH